MKNVSLGVVLPVAGQGARRLRGSRNAWALGLMLLGSGLAQAGTLIDTKPDAKSAIYSFGETDTTTYGQTFTVPLTDTRLDSFTFFLRPDFGVARFRAYVYAWDEALGQTEGAALFASGGRHLDAQPDGGFQRVTFLTKGVELEADKSYVAYFSAAGLFDGKEDATDWRSVGGDTYAGGHFVFHNSKGKFPNPGVHWSCGTGCSWEGPGSDLAFQMTFNMPPVPEPSTVALTLAGLGLVGAVARRRRPSGA